MAAKSVALGATLIALGAVSAFLFRSNSGAIVLQSLLGAVIVALGTFSFFWPPAEVKAILAATVTAGIVTIVTVIAFLLNFSTLTLWNVAFTGLTIAAAGTFVWVNVGDKQHR